MLIVIVIIYTFNNSYKIRGKFVHVTVTIVQLSYTLITAFITSELYYTQSSLNSVSDKNVFCNFVERRFALSICTYQNIYSWGILSRSKSCRLLLKYVCFSEWIANI